jgi:cytoskeletal protein RodZ
MKRGKSKKTVAQAIQEQSQIEMQPARSSVVSMKTQSNGSGSSKNNIWWILLIVLAVIVLGAGAWWIFFK